MYNIRSMRLINLLFKILSLRFNDIFLKIQKAITLKMQISGSHDKGKSLLLPYVCVLLLLKTLCLTILISKRKKNFPKLMT